jgi:hypothetical protein
MKESFELALSLAHSKVSVAVRRPPAIPHSLFLSKTSFFLFRNNFFTLFQLPKKTNHFLFRGERRRSARGRTLFFSESVQATPKTRLCFQRGKRGGELQYQYCICFLKCVYEIYMLSVYDSISMIVSTHVHCLITNKHL